MQLAAITDEISQDFEHALDVMLEYEAYGVELRGLWRTNIADLSEEQVLQAKSALKSRNMPAICLATPFYKCDLEFDKVNEGESVGRMHLATPRGLEQQMEMLQRCIRLAHTFETPLLRVFSFWRKAALTPEIEAQIISAFAEPVALAEKEGITLVLENEHACFIGTGEEAARIAKAVNSPNFKLVWDPGNALCADEPAFPIGYEAVKPWLTHVHVKDAIMRETEHHGKQPEWCVIGEGEIGYTEQFAALKKDGYTGYISLETHIKPPTGKTSEDVSRLCLSALQQFLSN